VVWLLVGVLGAKKKARNKVSYVRRIFFIMSSLSDLAAIRALPTTLSVTDFLVRDGVNWNCSNGQQVDNTRVPNSQCKFLMRQNILLLL
jgi:hypothetical protein